MSETAEATSRRAIRAATLLWMGSVLLSRVMGFLREIVIARQVGANAETDVYFTAFTLPDFVNYLLAGGALSITFIPIFAGYMSRQDEEEGWRVFSIITTFLALVLGSLIGLAMLFAPELAPLMASGFDLEQQERLVYLTRILLPAQFFIFQGFLLSAVQMAKGQHTFPALAPLLYNGGTILGGLLLGSTLGMEGFAWGVLVGAAVGNFGLQVYGASKVGLRWRPVLDLRHPGFLQYIRLSLPIMIGQSLIVWDEWLTRYFGSFLSAASISWLNYGRKLALVPQAVFGQAAGAASYPYLASKAAEGAVRSVYDALLEALRSVLVLALGTQVFLVVLAYEICFLLFRSGRFGEADVQATASVLMLFSVGIAAWSVQGLVARAYYAFQDTLTPTALGTAMTLASIPLYAVLSERLQHVGLALGSTLAISVYALLLWSLFVRKLKKRAPDEDFPPLAPFLLRLCGATLVGGLAAWGARAGLLLLTGDDSPLTRWLLELGLSSPRSDVDPQGTGLAAWLLLGVRCVGVGLVGGPVFVGACLALGVGEVRVIVWKLARKLLGAARARRLLGALAPPTGAAPGASGGRESHPEATQGRLPEG